MNEDFGSLRKLGREGALFPSVSCMSPRGLTVLEERTKRRGSELRVQNLPSLVTRVTPHPALCIRRDGTAPIKPVHLASTP